MCVFHTSSKLPEYPFRWLMKIKGVYLSQIKYFQNFDILTTNNIKQMIFSFTVQLSTLSAISRYLVLVSKFSTKLMILHPQLSLQIFHQSSQFVHINLLLVISELSISRVSLQRFSSVTADTAF